MCKCNKERGIKGKILDLDIFLFLWLLVIRTSTRMGLSLVNELLQMCLAAASSTHSAWKFMTSSTSGKCYDTKGYSWAHINTSFTDSIMPSTLKTSQRQDFKKTSVKYFEQHSDKLFKTDTPDKSDMQAFPNPCHRNSLLFHSLSSSFFPWKNECSQLSESLRCVPVE